MGADTTLVDEAISALDSIFPRLHPVPVPLYDATVTFVDGKSKTGLVESPFGGDYIFFKQNEGATVEELDTTTVKGIKFMVSMTIITFATESQPQN